MSDRSGRPDDAHSKRIKISLLIKTLEKRIKLAFPYKRSLNSTKHQPWHRRQWAEHYIDLPECLFSFICFHSYVFIHMCSVSPLHVSPHKNTDSTSTCIDTVVGDLYYFKALRTGRECYDKIICSGLGISTEIFHGSRIVGEHGAWTRSWRHEWFKIGWTERAVVVRSFVVFLCMIKICKPIFNWGICE